MIIIECTRGTCWCSSIKSRTGAGEYRPVSGPTAQADVLARPGAGSRYRRAGSHARYSLEHAVEEVDNQIALLRSKVATLESKKATLAKTEADYERASHW